MIPLSIYDLSSYLANFVSQFSVLWENLNTPIYELFTDALWWTDFLPESIVDLLFLPLKSFFSAFPDMTIFNFLLGAFSSIFILITVVKWLLDLFT